jgi:hypothetical protein
MRVKEDHMTNKITVPGGMARLVLKLMAMGQGHWQDREDAIDREADLAAKERREMGFPVKDFDMYTARYFTIGDVIGHILDRDPGDCMRSDYPYIRKACIDALMGDRP